MKEEHQPPVSSSNSANMLSFSITGHRYPAIPYPFFGQTIPYIPWEWMAGVPNLPAPLDPRWSSVGRGRCEDITQTSDDETKPNKASQTATSPANSHSSKTKSESAPSLIKFSIDDILKKEPRKRPSYVSIPGGYSLSKMLKLETEDDSDGEMMKSNQDLGFVGNSSRYSWLQCTRYRPPKLPRMKKKEGGKKRKLGRNPRVPFTQHQVAALEQKFHRTHYLSSADVAELSTALNLTETRVKIWFQNRRARERRDREGASRSELAANKPMTSSVSSSFPVSSILAWSSPVTPNPSTLTQFTNALMPGGKSAFKPISS